MASKTPRNPPPAPAPRRAVPPASARPPAESPGVPTVSMSAFSTLARSTSQGVRVMTRILLIDLAERELQARSRLKSRADQLQLVDNTKATSGGLSADQQLELKGLWTTLDSDAPVDEFYRTVAS